MEAVKGDNIFVIPFLCFGGCSFIRDFAYDNVANNRYTIFGRSDSCEI